MESIQIKVVEQFFSCNAVDFCQSAPSGKLTNFQNCLFGTLRGSDKNDKFFV